MCLDKLKARLGVSSSLDVVEKVDFLCRSQIEGRKAEKLLKKLNQIVDSDDQGVNRGREVDLVSGLFRRDSGFLAVTPALSLAPTQHKPWCHSSGQKLLQTLRRWKSDLGEVSQIHQNVEQLRRKLMGIDETAKMGDVHLTKELVKMTGE